MITNPSTIENKYKCNKYIKNWLIYNCHLPLLSFDKKYFYFANTDKLKKCLKEIPLGLKLLSKFSK
jgi:hypothetical protein